MVEYNPLDLENIKERQDEDDRLTQSTVRHPTCTVARLLTMLKTYYVTLNEVTMQPIGELHYLKI
jgi:hypothetical protein